MLRPQTYSEIISEYASTLSLKHVPSKIIIEAKKRLIDTLGCIVAGHSDDAVKIANRFTSGLGGKSQSSIILYGRKVPAQYAALVNGIMGHSLEIDDTLPGVAHVGVVIIPTALAVSEWLRSSGSDLLLSIIIGYEITCRIGRAALIGKLQDFGFHPTGINGTFGASVVTAKLMDLEPEKIATALGIGGSLASGLLEAQREGSLTKRFHAGWAAHNGIIAGSLAKEGYTAPHNIFEGRLGFFNAFVRNRETIDIIAKDLGSTYEIEKPNYKPYACCVASHPAISATLRVMHRYNIKASEIEKIEVGIQSWAVPLVCEPSMSKYSPTNTVDAQFSIYYSTAVAAIRRSAPLFEDFSLGNLRNPTVLKLARKVKAIVDPTLKDESYSGGNLHRLGSATILTRNGKQYHMDSGDSFYRMSLDEVKNKFIELTRSTFTPTKVDHILEAINELEKLESIDTLLRSITHKQR